MKITVLSPILAPELEEGGVDHRTRYRMRDCAGVPAQFEFGYIDQGPRFIVNGYDDAYAAPDLIRKALVAEENGADAVVINCSADTGLRACREALSIPVVGPTESTMLFAPQLVDSFTVLTFSSRINGRFHRIARELGVEHCLHATRSVEIDFDEISNGEEHVVDALYREIRYIREQEGCDGFVLGCTDFEDVAPRLDDRLLRDNVDVVLLKPFEIAVYQAFAMAAMGLRQGRCSYPIPQFRLH